MNWGEEKSVLYLCQTRRSTAFPRDVSAAAVRREKKGELLALLQAESQKELQQIGAVHVHIWQLGFS